MSGTYKEFYLIDRSTTARMKFDEVVLKTQGQWIFPRKVHHYRALTGHGTKSFERFST